MNSRRIMFVIVLIAAILFIFLGTEDSSDVREEEEEGDPNFAWLPISGLRLVKKP